MLSPTPGYCTCPFTITLGSWAISLSPQYEWGTVGRLCSEPPWVRLSSRWCLFLTIPTHQAAIFVFPSSCYLGREASPCAHSCEMRGERWCTSGGRQGSARAICLCMLPVHCGLAHAGSGVPLPFHVLMAFGDKASLDVKLWTHGHLITRVRTWQE